MIVDCSEYQLTINIRADTKEDLIYLLKEIQRRIKMGMTTGDGNYCLGSYEWILEDSAARKERESK